MKLPAAQIRNAFPSEFKSIGELMVQVYSKLDGFPSAIEQPQYFHLLANIGDLTMKPKAELLVAISNADQSDQIAGAVVYFGDLKYYGASSLIQYAKDAGAFRFLAVNEAFRNQGIGKLLAQECIQKARSDGRSQLIIHSTLAMQNAWSMYKKLGFERAEDLDFLQGKLQVFGFRLMLN